MMVMIIMMTWQIKEEKRGLWKIYVRDENENDEDLNEYIWIGEIGWKETVGRDVRSGGEVVGGDV
jgi:hypothetical protein